MKYQFISTSVEDTARLATELAQGLSPGSLVALEGDLAAGKTTFSQAFARAIGVTDTVNSPTFTIIKEYEGRTFPFYHMDVYRITLLEAEELGLEEYFYGSGITLVEWASRVEPLLPKERLDVRIQRLLVSEDAVTIVPTETSNDGQSRVLLVQPHGALYEEVCRQLEERNIWS